MAGAGFLIMWDNAYTVHHHGDQQDELEDLLALADQAGTTDQVAVFASTSKITPRNPYLRWRTGIPISNLAVATTRGTWVSDSTLS